MTDHPAPTHDPEPAHDPGHDGIAGHFRSVDSAPARYAVDRPASASNGFYLTFAGLCILAMCVQTVRVHLGIGPRTNDVVILAGDRGDVASLTRIFVLFFFLTYAGYAYGDRRRRLLLGLSLAGKFVAACVVIDLIGWALAHFGLLDIPVLGQQAASGLLALMVFPHTILRQAQLPAAGPGPLSPWVPLRAYAILFDCLLLAVGGALAVVYLLGDLVRWFRDVALLGGIGPGVFLVQQFFGIATALIGVLVLRRGRRTPFSPPVAVLVPAHNEAHDIGATIASVDRAARTYPGRIRLYVVDNASTDGTATAAADALAECTRIDGTVLDCPTPGKAIALNLGIAQITEEFIVRIDADTVIGPGCLKTAMAHFADPTVGSVGGLPLPATEKTWIDKVRLVEVILRHGFFQLSLDGYRGVLGVPGMFAIYRHSALRLVGDMVTGMNGEDTDICLRLDGAGYRTVADPRAVYYSETPASYAHLREQRTRWFRSIYHLAAHNRAMLLDGRTMTGTAVLPLQLMNAARRAMLAPILLFALIADVVFQPTFQVQRWQPVVATILGMQFVLAIGVCLVLLPRALRYLPLYLVFRILRSYFTLGAALSLVYPPVPAFRTGFRGRRPGGRRERYAHGSR
ncbi:glycosyltransferase [Gordonia sp. FQ]|uniref:glycosyltransferase n=1 Tax=Gordonia sp. FQ TaxID=3446634 RepID=UPI003F83DB2B